MTAQQGVDPVAQHGRHGLRDGMATTRLRWQVLAIFRSTDVHGRMDDGRAGGPADGEDAMTEPVPFEVYEEGVYLHGTRAVLRPGDMLTPSRPSNFREDAPLRHVYVTSTMHAAAWGAQLAKGEGEPRVYVVEPTGELEDDPNVTDKKLPGNPTRSYRSLEPVRVVRELEDWPRHSAESVQAMLEGLAALREAGEDRIID